MAPLKIGTLNVNGMNAAVRRRAFFSKIRKEGLDLCLLQECHSVASASSIWQSEWGGPAFFSHGLSNSRGVMILLRRGLECQVKQQIADEDRRLLLLEIEINGDNFVFGSVYAPTSDKPEEQNSFLDNLTDKLEALDTSNLVLGGDFNVALDPIRDRRGERNPGVREICLGSGS